MKFGHVILVAVVAAVLAAVCAEAAGSLTAGVAVKGFHEFSPIGVPLAGYNHGARRVPDVRCFFCLSGERVECCVCVCVCGCVCVVCVWVWGWSVWGVGVCGVWVGCVEWML